MQGKLGICIQENVSDPYLKPFHLVQKINSKHIIDLNMKSKAIILLEENIKKNLCNLKVIKGFLEHKQ